MQLTVVGSGDAFGSGGRFNTCFLLETAKATLLVDCGASSLVALQTHGLDPNRIDGAELSIVECYGYSGEMTGHLTWEVIKPRLPDLRARRIMVTHMNPTMLARCDEVRAAGVLVAEDGLVVKI